MSWSNLPAPEAAQAGQISPEVSWSTLDGVFVLLCAFIIYVVGSVIVDIISFPIEGKHIGFWVIPTSYIFLTIGTFGMSAWWLVGRRHATWGSLGFRLPAASSVPAAIGRIVLVAFVAYICVTIGSAIIVGLFDLTTFHIKSNVKELLPPGQSRIDLAQYLTLVLVGAILAPITEETLFRGVLYQGLRRDVTRVVGFIPAIGVSALVTGLLFGGFHLIGGSSEVYTLPVLVYLGIVLALSFQVADSLGGSVLVHASVNFISITALFAQAH